MYTVAGTGGGGGGEEEEEKEEDIVHRNSYCSPDGAERRAARDAPECVPGAGAGAAGRCGGARRPRFRRPPVRVVSETTPLAIATALLGPRTTILV